jgi:hypothetical protein
MKFRILIVMISSVGLAVSGLANAATITYNNYTLNPSTNIVTHTDGTEWLQWDVTEGDSISEALISYASDGWVLAGNDLMATLFGHFGWNVGSDENTMYNIQKINYTPLDDVTPMDEFIELFGATSVSVGGNVGIGNASLVTSRAWFGSDDDDDGLYNMVAVMSDYSATQSNGSTAWVNNRAMVTTELAHDNYSDNYYGVALVRSAPVSEPASLAIFVLGTIGLALRRFKKQSKKISSTIKIDN